MDGGNIEIVNAGEGDISALCSVGIHAAGGAKDAAYFTRCLQEQAAGARNVLLAHADGLPAGFAVLNWRPSYALYKRLGIPEIQDLNVAPDFRRRGIATALIRYCEDLARAKGCAQAGISVGLDSGYGAAQRLYVKLGYMPDGFGVTYDREPVRRGELRPVDDDLCLMLVRDL